MAPSDPLDNCEGGYASRDSESLLRAMELFFAVYFFTSSILFEVSELIADLFRVKAEPNTDAHKRIRRMLIIAEEPSRRLLGPAPLLMRRAANSS